ncbi:hypothetical protein LPTSP4_13220 [Leptospira ryugenii]|uniref:Uncharacterized protein n=1 Tax=Leptospira ryugenii TaxID=1917863 RepID=A0A2P2DYW0_9LEPT|nr:hypothetical protein [Leptospira ryugenii]GBF49803.1 hypothetical protein LPTSP4_13220 [Leptospira ryugenii]
MKPIVYLLIFCLSLSVLAKSTMSYRERKKHFDQRIQLIFDVRETLSIPEEETKNPLHQVKLNVEEAYRAGAKAEMEKNLSLAEGEIAFVGRKLCLQVEEIASDIYGKAQSAFYQTESQEKQSAKKMEWETKEKVNRYLGMAKLEKDHAKEFFISGNYHLSLHTYKRSILYSLLSLRAQGLESPSGYEAAHAAWAEPVWQTGKQQKSGTIQTN